MDESDMDEILFFGSDVSTRFLKFCEFNGHYGRDEALHLLRELSRRKCFKDVAPEGGIQTLEDVRNLEDPNPEGYRVVPKKIKDLWECVELFKKEEQENEEIRKGKSKIIVPRGRSSRRPSRRQSVGHQGNPKGTGVPDRSHDFPIIMPGRDRPSNDGPAVEIEADRRLHGLKESRAADVVYKPRATEPFAGEKKKFAYVLGIDIGACTSSIAYAKTSHPHTVVSDFELNRLNYYYASAGFLVQSSMWKDPETRDFYLMRRIDGIEDDELDIKKGFLRLTFLKGLIGKTTEELKKFLDENEDLKAVYTNVTSDGGVTMVELRDGSKWAPVELLAMFSMRLISNVKTYLGFDGTLKEFIDLSTICVCHPALASARLRLDLSTVMKILGFSKEQIKLVPEPLAIAHKALQSGHLVDKKGKLIQDLVILDVGLYSADSVACHISEEMKEIEGAGPKKHVVLEVKGYNAPLKQQKPARTQQPQDEDCMVDEFSDPCGRDLDILAAKRIVYDNSFIKEAFNIESGWLKHWDREKDEDCDENTKVSPFIPWVRANNEDEAKSKVFLQKLVEEFYCKAEKMKKEMCNEVLRKQLAGDEIKNFGRKIEISNNRKDWNKISKDQQEWWTNSKQKHRYTYVQSRDDGGNECHFSFGLMVSGTSYFRKVLRPCVQKHERVRKELITRVWGDENFKPYIIETGGGAIALSIYRRYLKANGKENRDRDHLQNNHEIAYGVSSGCVIAGLIHLGHDVLDGTSLEIRDKSPTSLYTEFTHMDEKVPMLRPWVKTGEPYPLEPQVDEVEISLGEPVEFKFYESSRTDLPEGDIDLAEWEEGEKLGTKSIVVDDREGVGYAMKYQVKDGLMDAELVSSSGRIYKVLLDTAWTEEQIEEARFRMYSKNCVTYYEHERREMLEDVINDSDDDGLEDDQQEPPKKKVAT